MSPTKNYTVEKKFEIRRMNKSGEVEVLYQIYATSAGGTYYHVDVPESALEQADKLLEVRAAKLDAIK